MSLDVFFCGCDRAIATIATNYCLFNGMTNALCVP